MNRSKRAVFESPLARHDRAAERAFRAWWRLARQMPCPVRIFYNWGNCDGWEKREAP